MPYKHQKLYSRAWIRREYEDRIEKAMKKLGKTKLQLFNQAVDTFLTSLGFPSKSQ